MRFVEVGKDQLINLDLVVRVRIGEFASGTAQEGKEWYVDGQTTFGDVYDIFSGTEEECRAFYDGLKMSGVTKVTVKANLNREELAEIAKQMPGRVVFSPKEPDYSNDPTQSKYEIEEI